MDHTDLLERFIALLNEQQIRYCVIGGQAVNAYVDPVVSLDLDVVIAVEQLELLEQLLAAQFSLKRFPHSLNIGLPGSDLRIQIQLDQRYADFPQRADIQNVLGLGLPVASLQDTLQGKIWAALDPERRASKRQKDLADLARLIEDYPDLRAQVPTELLDRLF
ncbi:nucleotidyl transferase AbiEii/AbiGii toxin family protein [Candidatus Chloroploca sp. Khr17]|uniref:nucleotidyl transferase AbiEii/AbiGii toxin family protein n=1 Tax=Candidatus Chloroploca sp. Khr17 TaxID=2496869 RepID=UPI0013EC8032|nr:nucleotidyl transferase AbiEii/AbiGii toxin family protein [Candidatus Chloroploca sp. Khr17]